MASLTIIHPDSLKFTGKLIYTLNCQSIRGPNFTLLASPSFKDPCMALASKLDLSTIDIDLEFSSPESDPDQANVDLALIIQKALMPNNNIICISDEGFASFFATKELDIHLPSSLSKFSVTVFKPALSGWKEEIIPDFNIDQIPMLEQDMQLIKEKKFAEFIVTLSNKLSKKKVNDYGGLRFQFAAAETLVNRSIDKVIRGDLENISENLKGNEENTKAIIQSLLEKIQEIKENVRKINEVIEEKIPKCPKEFNKINGGELGLPIMRFSNDSITLMEKQSIDRRNHEFVIVNNKDYELKHLKLYIVEHAKCLLDFKLEANEVKKVEFAHEYDLLRDGSFNVVVLSCSLPMCRYIIVPLIELRLSEVKPKTVIVSNRFVTQDQCALRRDKVTLKIFKIMHFDTLELSLDSQYEGPQTISVILQNGKLISNILEC